MSDIHNNTTSSIFDIDDKLALARTQQIRNTAISQLFTGNKLPDEQEDREILLKLLDGVDRQVMSKARIKSDDQANKSNAAMADIIATALTQVSNVAKGVRNNEKDITLEVNLDNSLILPNETKIGLEELDYGTFMKETSHLDKQL